VVKNQSKIFAAYVPDSPERFSFNDFNELKTFLNSPVGKKKGENYQYLIHYSPTLIFLRIKGLASSLVKMRKNWKIFSLNKYQHTPRIQILLALVALKQICHIRRFLQNGSQNSEWQ
jgi:hypothetical protein